METHPHPWIGNRKPRERYEGFDQSGNSVGMFQEPDYEIALLDPQETLPLLMLHEGGDSVFKMIEEGIIKVDNAP